MAEVYPAPQPPAKKGRNWKLIGGVVAGTLVLMCACLAFAANSGSNTLASQTATALALGAVAVLEPTGEATVGVAAEAPEPTEAPAPTDVPEPTGTPEPTPTDAPTNTPAPQRRRRSRQHQLKSRLRRCRQRRLW